MADFSGSVRTLLGALETATDASYRHACADKIVHLLVASPGAMEPMLEELSERLRRMLGASGREPDPMLRILFGLSIAHEMAARAKKGRGMAQLASELSSLLDDGPVDEGIAAGAIQAFGNVISAALDRGSELGAPDAQRYVGLVALGRVLTGWLRSGETAGASFLLMGVTLAIRAEKLAEARKCRQALRQLAARRKLPDLESLASDADFELAKALGLRTNLAIGVAKPAEHEAVRELRELADETGEPRVASVLAMALSMLLLGVSQSQAKEMLALLRNLASRHPGDLGVFLWFAMALQNLVSSGVAGPEEASELRSLLARNPQLDEAIATMAKSR
jgi:hypothetical protein